MLFKPESKVQKDRVIMRETDTRMAKYSRRGLIVNFLAYLLCFSLGDIHIVAPTTAVVLTAGLIITLLIRAYILIRFEAIYSRGPSRWRSLFFIVTLIGAAWWSAILVTLTLVLGMVSETPILWLYTVIFFSTTIQVTAPFRDFSRIYLAVALFPPALAAFYSGGFDGYMYGLMMVVFILSLDHQAEMLSTTHWQRLASNLELKQKARALQIEQNKINASVELNTQFLKSLWRELEQTWQVLSDKVPREQVPDERAPGEGPAENDSGRPDGAQLLSTTESTTEAEVNEAEVNEAEVGATASTAEVAAALETQKLLLRNLDMFTHINTHQVDTEVVVFPLRASLERWVDEFQPDAYEHDIELNYRIYPECPEAVKGDPKLIARIFANLLGNAIKYSGKGEIFIDFDFRVCNDDIGQLEITIVDRCAKAGVEGTVDLDKVLSATRFSGLWFPICKSLAEFLGGTIEANYDKENYKEMRYMFRLPVTLVSSEEEPATDATTAEPSKKDLQDS